MIVVPSPSSAIDPNGPAGLVRKAVHLRQAKTRALADSLGREERIEHFRSDVVRNSDAGIVHSDIATWCLFRSFLAR